MAIVMLLLFYSMLFMVKSITASWSQDAKYSLYRVTAFNNYERRALYDMHLQNVNIIFLSGVTNDAALPMDIIVNECCTVDFEMTLQARYIEYVNIDSDQIQDEFNTVNKLGNKNKTDISETFLNWDSILKWVDNKCKSYSKLKKIILGVTYEKRDMLLLKLSTGRKNPAVFIMGGEQGRDWISPAIVLNFINYLLENQKDILLSKFDFYFVPVFNPDGYEYSMKHNRFWNKNRKTFFPLKQCLDKETAVGVDIDRNWFLTKAKPHINEECQSVYLGKICLTEEETKDLSTFLNSIATNLLAFINLRGFENLITVPYADTDRYASNQAILMEMLLFACEKTKKVFNVTYRFSDTESCFFNFSGNSADWVKYKLNVPIVYTMYMKLEPDIFPHTEHIIPLFNQFKFMTQEMLLLGNSIYGPLFSKKTILCGNMFGIILVCLVILIWI